MRKALFQLSPVYLGTPRRQATIARCDAANTEALMAIDAFCSQERLEPSVQTELERVAHDVIQLLHTEERGQQSAASIRTGKSQIGGSRVVELALPFRKLICLSSKSFVPHMLRTEVCFHGPSWPKHLSRDHNSQLPRGEPETTFCCRTPLCCCCTALPSLLKTELFTFSTCT